MKGILFLFLCMVKIYYADSKSIGEKNNLTLLLEKLPKEMRDKALRYRRIEDTLNFVLGKLMLKKGLEEMGVDNDLGKIQFNENGKPFLENVFFNITHSENRVVCAITQSGEIGIDIEKEKEIDLSNFENFFTPKEWTKITEHPFPLKKFYWYWVRKESIIKALGVNLSFLNQIELDAESDFFLFSKNKNTEKSKKWFLKNLDFGDEYFFAICSEVEFEVVQMEEMRIF
ncbi:MAG TPA: 4'-phosphopantetheinyl transferase superfamily protein [Phaeodactylibacter sp.]|nr:4'-phosphopantetheinyl transferase superfamily protein [Phaeodactylibacter sp.]